MDEDGNSKDQKKGFMESLRKAWEFRKYLIIEPFLCFWVLPSLLIYVGLQNFGLDKACRVNLGMSKLICDNILDKSLSNIDCDTYTDKLNDTSTFILLNNVTQDSVNFNLTVCKAETEAQKLVTNINGIRGPIASIFPIIVILFAGGWSDRHNIRKPCMIFSLIGEILSVTVLFISAIFFDSIPMEYGNILEKVLPAMFGGFNLMLMGMYSYITATTKEADRTFRFGIFSMCFSIIPFIGLPFAGTLYEKLGYVRLFGLGLAILLLGMLYLIFFIKEVKENDSATENDVDDKSRNGKDNQAFETIEPITTNVMEIATIEIPVSTLQNEIQNETKVPKQKKESSNKCNLVEFFDPTLAYDCIKVLIKRRKNNGRLFFILLLITFFLVIGPVVGEADYLYQFILLKLKWSPDQYSIFSTFSSAMSFAGTFLMTSVFSKALKMSDPMVGFISAVATIISRILFGFSSESIMYYAAGTADMFVSVRAIAIRTITASLVGAEELGRLFSLLGLLEPFAGFIFPPLYSWVYSSTVEEFPGTFYLFSEIFCIPCAILFAILYFWTKKAPKTDENAHDDKKQTTDNADIEGTYL